MVSDGGGVKEAALRPITGADKVLRFVVGVTRKAGAPFTVSPTVVNGNPAFVVRLGDAVDGVLALRVEQSRVVGLYYVRNPDKLRAWAR